MTPPTARPADPSDDSMGVEPEEEAGAGYGNHAPDAAEQPTEATDAD